MAFHVLEQGAAACRCCGLWRCRPVVSGQCDACVPPMVEALGAVAGAHLAALIRAGVDLIALRSDPEHLWHLDVAAAAVELRWQLIGGGGSPSSHHGGRHHHHRDDDGMVVTFGARA